MLDLCVGLHGLNWSPDLSKLGLDEEEVMQAAFRTRISAPLHSLLYEPSSLYSESREDALQEIRNLKPKLDRAWDGLRIRFASTLAAQTVVERYKTRVEEYDRQRMREIADREIARVDEGKAEGKKPKSQLEDLLARDLNLYLYDEGYRVLYRPRYDDLEPDILSIGPRPLLVEAKAYSKSGSARAEIREGFAQCLSYLSVLSSSAASNLYEAHLTVFRLGGPLYGLPEVFVHSDFRIYPVLIDLAASEERGRQQARTSVGDITEEEIRDHITKRSLAKEEN